MKSVVNERNGGGHDQRGDCDHHHDFDEREGPVNRGVLSRTADLRSGLWWYFHLPVLMFAVIANIADRTLNNNMPTPTAIKMIIAGSIKLVMTRKAMVNSLS